MIKVSSLNSQIEDKYLIKDINFTVNDSEVISIIGPSGAGKSSLLKSLNGLIVPTLGTIQVNDFCIDFTSYKNNELDKLSSYFSMVFQSYNVFRNKTALENVMMPMTIVQKINKKESEEKALEILNMVGLIDSKDKYPSQLSGGEKQRIGIGRALAVNSKVILFDEPTSSLDPELVNDILNIIKDLSTQGITMLIVTHEITFAENISDKIIFMDDGQLIDFGTPEKVLRKNKNTRILKFLENC